jgi:hypothetical protein
MKTVFIRAIEAPVDEKAGAIREAMATACRVRFDVDLATFGRIPRSPFAYWVSAGVSAAFSRFAPFEGEDRSALGGLKTLNDPRFVRLWWECSSETGDRWPALAKGGRFSPYYADVYLRVHWGAGGRDISWYGYQRRPREGFGAASRGIEAYFRPGLTWPRRTNGLSFRVMPAGCIFADKGPAAFVKADGSQELLALCAVVNSAAFGALVAVQLARTELAQSFEVGLIQQTPVPSLKAEDANELSSRARRSWSLKRRLDTRAENSHAFLLPALLQTDGESFVERAQGLGQVTAAAHAELDAIAEAIDDHAYRLYGISDVDRQRIAQGFDMQGEAEESPIDDDGDESEDDGEVAEVDATPMVASLLSWTLGVAFGRFDVRLSTGEREAPPEPEPFDPLPVCSPGMLTGDNGLPVAAPPRGYPLTFPLDGILVDDPGHPRDVVRAVRSVFESIFDDASARWHEAAELLGAPDLRSWFARDFFEPHIKRYSKSRRKAPIYWQLATASGSYSVWIYIHRATADTLFRVLNDFVGPKLDHEKAKLDGLTQEAGGNPSAAQRREIEQQETFVGELQALKTEVARVAPLWKPNLDDGVILNFAPLWRLVPQNRSWQGECKKAWDKLVAGDYDWAHVAMHLWPERVVPKCIDDRSLAIAHGLEDALWREDGAGTWRKRPVDDAALQLLINERTSSTVKAALNDLLSAQNPTNSGGRRSAPRATASRPAAPTPGPATVAPAVRAPAAESIVDNATLAAVRGAIGAIADGASKADVLAATGLTDADWNKAIGVLLDRGLVSKSGQKRSTRYHTHSVREEA